MSDLMTEAEIQLLKEAYFEARIVEWQNVRKARADWLVVASFGQYTFRREGAEIEYGDKHGPYAQAGLTQPQAGSWTARYEELLASGAEIDWDDAILFPPDQYLRWTPNTDIEAMVDADAAPDPERDAIDTSRPLVFVGGMMLGRDDASSVRGAELRLSERLVDGFLASIAVELPNDPASESEAEWIRWAGHSPVGIATLSAYREAESLLGKRVGLCHISDLTWALSPVFGSRDLYRVAEEYIDSHSVRGRTFYIEELSANVGTADPGRARIARLKNGLIRSVAPRAASPVNQEALDRLTMARVRRYPVDLLQQRVYYVLGFGF